MAEQHPIPSHPLFQDLNGKIYGKLTILFYAGRKSGKYSLWHCRCECGRERTVVSSQLTLGQTNQCTYCFRHQPKTKTRSDFTDLTGQTFGRLTVTSFSRRNKKTNRTYFMCQCTCGETTESRSDSLISGSIQSCGCLNISRKWIDQPIPEELQCRKCKKTYPLNKGNFYRHPHSKYGFNPICGICTRERISKWNRKDAGKLRVQCLIAYSGNPPKCQCQGCNETNIEFLTIDHVGGWGHKHRRELHGNSIYRWLKINNFPDKFRVLCMNCNHARGKYGYCPHCKECGLH